MRRDGVLHPRLQAGVIQSTRLQAGVIQSTRLRAGVIQSTRLRAGVIQSTRLRAGVIQLCVLFVLVVTFSSSSASTLATPCAEDEAHCRLSGGFTAVSVSDPRLPGITSPSSPAFGALIYADYKHLEEAARASLTRALAMRESISPYRDDNDFEKHLRNLDFQAGWDQTYAGTTPYTEGLTFTQLVDAVERDLAQARDIYAYLAIFAPQDRFRSDSDYTASLCGVTDKEEPNPADPAHSGQVLPPVIDWCNFQARLRQSVREAANVRMILGQEFMVDALGMNFSGGFLGGDEFVKNEVAQLRAARHQFEKAEEFLSGALKRAVGSGCLISDFYTQTEWSLLSRAAELQGTTQYHIATRLSYLDIGSPQSVPQAQTAAENTFRQSINDGYIKLVGLVSLGPIEQERCAMGERPDGDLVAEMATNLLEAQRQARELADGRNIFGFDVTFTPARAYRSSSVLNCDTNTSGDRGLWDEAQCSAQLAATLQEREENKTRLFDISQQELNAAVDKIRQGLDTTIFSVSGCDRNALPSDNAYYVCVEGQITKIEECLEKAYLDAAIFDACMDPANLNSGTGARTALNELRSIYLEYEGIKQSARNIKQRIELSTDANATVTDWLLISGVAETTARVAQVAFDTIDCTDFSGDFISTAASAGVCGTVGALNGAAQTVAGALSTAADVKIANAANDKETGNLLLDMSELVIAAQSAQQAFFSKKSDVRGILDALLRNLRETQRQRAYFASSPANDPSFRIVRDSARIELADALERAARISYLAARRAEYEYAARLSASNFRISDIYRARTAQDILRYLNELQGVTASLAGGTIAETTAVDLKVSVARHVLQLTDEKLASEGFATPAAIQAERAKRFRAWVAEHTVANDFEAPKDGKPVLRFSLTTSLQESGLFANVIPQGYDRQWRIQLGGIATPKASSNGVSINLVSQQPDLSYRKVAMTQGGLVHLRSQAGCTFDYKLIAPATLLGLEWAKNQNPEQATALFNANVNETHAYVENGFRSPRFEGRPISATRWEILVFAGAPDGLGLPEMDLQQLTDLELILSAVYSSRSPGRPEPSECSRIDW